MKAKALDLTEEYPRSPKEKLGGYVHLARMIDKARAKEAGMLGEYIYPCPLDQALLGFLGVDADAFLKEATEGDDQGIIEWLQHNAKVHTPEQIDAWNKVFLTRTPQNEESRQRFLKTRERVAPNRTDVTRWIDLLDLEEGREVPQRTVRPGGRE